MPTLPAFILLPLASVSPSAVLQERPVSRPRHHFPVPNASVTALAEHDGVLYAGGQFDRVGTFTGTMAVMHGMSAELVPFPAIRGEIRDIVSDGSGGWFVAGDIDQVGEDLRQGVVHLTASGHLSSWNPGVRGEVSALLLDGDTLYLAGHFDIAGGAQLHFAAVDAHTAELRPWNPAVPVTGPFAFEAGEELHDLARIADTIFIAGGFTDVRIGGEIRSNLALVDAEVGQALPIDWAPDAAVLDLLPSGESMWVAGWFTSIGGKERSRVALLEREGVSAVSVDPMDDGVASIAQYGDVLFLGGSFTRIGRLPRSCLAAMNSTTGQVLPWSPAVSGFDGAGTQVDALVMQGGTVHVAGAFRSIAGEARQSLAAVDAVSGAVLDWDARIAGEPISTRVHTLAVQGDLVAAGGNLQIAHSVARVGSAAFDVASGAVLPWDPAAGPVSAIAVGGDRVFLGGNFTTVNGVQRPRLAAVDATSGALDTTFDAGFCHNSGVPFALACNGPSLFVGASCLNRCGQGCQDLHALDALTGAPIDGWDANTNGSVRAFALSADGGTLYVGGDFEEIGSTGGLTPHDNLAALDAATGFVTEWNPDASDRVSALILDGPRLLAGGSFLTVGGLLRRYVAELDPAFDVPGPWDPLVNGSGTIDVSALALNDRLVFLGGGFATVGGEYRPYLAAADAITGMPLDWAPVPRTGISELVVAGDMLVVAGGDGYERAVTGQLVVFDLVDVRVAPHDPPESTHQHADDGRPRASGAKSRF